MAKCFLHGNGGSDLLNFKVVGGTAAPSNPKENTIWVNTSTNITDWVFSATQPSSAAGRVWIKTGISSSVYFNSLKKNCINVYPLAAKQYVSGAWVDVTAKSYQNGKWCGWYPYGYLFSSNNGLAPGHTLVLKKGSDGSEVIANETNILFRASTVESPGIIGIGFAERIDFSDFNTLNCRFQLDQSGANNAGSPYGAHLGVKGTSLSDNLSLTNWEVFTVADDTLGDKILSVDISALSSGYVMLCGIMSGILYDFWME